MMEEKLETAKNALSTAAQQFDDMARPKKPVLVNQPQYLKVSFGQLDIPKIGTTSETG